MSGLSTVDAFKHIHSDSAILLDDSQLHKLQETLNSILDDVISVCDKYGIVYTLGGGSVLGAVRHNGFIPWDDDIDINMTRADYNKFIPLFSREFGDKYWIHTPEDTDNYGLSLARIRLKDTIVKTKEDFFNDECGAFVDLFVVENTFDNAILRMIHGLGCMAFGLALSCRKFWRDRKYLLELADGNSKLLRVFRFKVFLGFLIAWGSMNFWTRTTNKWNALCKNDNSKFVCIPVGRKHFFGELYKRSDVCDTVDVLYEGKLRKCPANYDMYLTALYGDYMQIPKEEDRELHVFFDFKL